MKRYEEWQLQQAKAKFSKLLERTHHDGPQIVTKHGVPTAVVLSVRDYERLKGKKKSLKAYLRKARGLHQLDLSRDPGEGDRPIDL